MDICMIWMASTSVNFPSTLNSSDSNSNLGVVNYKKYCSVARLGLDIDFKSLPQFPVIQVNEISVFTGLYVSLWIMNDVVMCYDMYINIITRIMCHSYCLQWYVLDICSRGYEGLTNPCVCWYFIRWQDINMVMCDYWMCLTKLLWIVTSIV